MNEITLEPNISRACTIINEYKKLKEETEKRLKPTKEELDERKTNELEKAKNKIYNYFEKIQDALPNRFMLEVKLDFSIRGYDRTYIYFEDNNDIKLVIPSRVDTICYDLSRKNKEYHSKRCNMYFSDCIVDLVKNWDKIQNKVETEIQKYFEGCIEREIDRVCNNINTVELLEEFNS